MDDGTLDLGGDFAVSLESFPLLDDTAGLDDFATLFHCVDADDGNDFDDFVDEDVEVVLECVGAVDI